MLFAKLRMVFVDLEFGFSMTFKLVCKHGSFPKEYAVQIIRTNVSKLHCQMAFLFHQAKVAPSVKGNL